MASFEVNFDGLVGPTHNYSGLSSGNLASTSNKAGNSSPLKAVLQGLEKMKKLADLGLKQALLPPQERPLISALKRLGFEGTDESILEKVSRKAPELLAGVSSASCMWTANSSTVSPSGDTADRKVHFTPANLVSKFHRSLEPQTTGAVLRNIFSDPKFFVHHDALPATPQMGDEGAANHTRLCATYGGPGVEFFVFGKYSFRSDKAEPQKFPARQSYEASRAIVQMHKLREDAVVLAQQSPDAIDAGVFHNDVVGVGNQNVYFYHEKAHDNSKQVMKELSEKFEKTCGQKLKLVEVSTADVSLKEAVSTYLFNGQLITLPNGKSMALILPVECQESPAVSKYLKALLADSSQPIREAIYFDLKQSMRNGGGPACLRLRVVLSEQELQAAHPGVFMNDILYKKLEAWAKRHYRDELHVQDLGDPALLKESRAALQDLATILGF